jgi:LPS O-antigen subunit length determinant protein (WzzB/FepE family)
MRSKLYCQEMIQTMWDKMKIILMIAFLIAQAAILAFYAAKMIN